MTGKSTKMQEMKFKEQSNRRKNSILRTVKSENLYIES